MFLCFTDCLCFISDILLIYSAVELPVCLMNLLTYLLCAFSALTLLVWWQEWQRPVKKLRVVGYWHGYLSVARCRLAYGIGDATVTHCLLLQ